MYLLRVLFCEGQHGSYMEHHLPILVFGVHWLQARLSVLSVQPSPKPAKLIDQVRKLSVEIKTPIFASDVFKIEEKKSNVKEE